MGKAVRILPVILFLIAATFLLPSFAMAGAVLTYHGRLMDQTNRPLEGNLTFRVRIYSPLPAKCLLYEETRNVSLAAADQGVFVIPIGDGAAARTGNDPNLMMEKIFANNGISIPGLNCNSVGFYTPQALDQRQMEVSYDDHSGYGWDNLPPMTLNYVPFAVNANDTQNVGGTPAASILKVSSGTATPLSAANFTELLSLLNGSSTQYERVGKINGVNVPTLTNGQLLGWSGGAWSAVNPATLYTETDPSVKSFAKADLPTCSANHFLRNNGGSFECVAVSGSSSGTVTSVAAGTGLLTDQASNAAITGTGTLSVDVGVTAGQIVQLETGAKLPAVDGSQLTNINAATATTASGLTGTASINTTGTITASQLTSTGTITAAGNITSSGGDIFATNGNIQTNKAITAKDGLFLYDQKTPTPNSVGIRAPADVPTNYVLTLPATQGGNGEVLGMSATTGQLTWITPTGGGGGSVTGVSADLPLSVDSSNAAVPKVSMPAATASQDGYLKKEDFATFNGKADTSDSRFTDSRAPSGSAGGDLGNTYPNPTVEKIKGQTVSGTASTNGQVLRYSSGSWVPSAVRLSELAGISGTVGSAFNVGSCNSGQTMAWSSLTDSFTCTPISITSSQISDLAAGANPAGSGSEVQFRSSGTAFGANTNFVWDNTNARLGVGTATPTSKLEVAGQIKITGGSPGPGKVLTSDLNGLASWVAPATSGTVTGVTASAPLVSDGNTTTPNITINRATASVDGYLSSTDWSTFNSKLGTSLGDGLVWVGTAGVATARTLKIADINSTFGGAWFGASGLCSNGTSLQYVSASDTVSCQAYALTSSQVTTALGFTPANGSSYVAKSGDTMSGTLNLPSNGLVVGTDQLTVNGGNVGVGVTSAASKLQVGGAITNTVSTYSTSFNCTTSTLNFANSNFMRLSPSNTISAASCTVTLSNLVAGGSYSLVVTGNAAVNAITYAFAGYTFKYLPLNGPTVAGKDSIYTFLYDGTTVYVTWAGGY